MTEAVTRFASRRSANDNGRIEIDAHVGSRTEHLFVKTGDARIEPGNEALVALTVLPSMQTGNEIQIDGPISALFRAGFEVIVDIYSMWQPGLKRSRLRGGTTVRRDAGSGRGVGIFFSGGVDSSYTLLKNLDDITHLILIGGFEKSSLSGTAFSRAAELVQNAARQLGKRAIILETNLRPFFSSYRLPWGPLAFGAAQAAVGHLLTPELERIYTAGGHTYSYLIPAGTHPLLDPNWNTEALAFVHDGLEATRIDKVRRIAQDERALAWLRVCPNPPEGAYNCGRCEKCIRTMINLHSAGTLERCPTFPKALDPGAIARLDVVNLNHEVYFWQNIRELKQTREDRRIAGALREAIRRAHAKRRARELARALLPGPYRVGRGIYHRLRGTAPDPQTDGAA